MLFLLLQFHTKCINRQVHLVNAFCMKLKWWLDFVVLRVLLIQLLSNRALFVDNEHDVVCACSLTLWLWERQTDRRGWRERGGERICD